MEQVERRLPFRTGMPRLEKPWFCADEGSRLRTASTVIDPPAPVPVPMGKPARGLPASEHESPLAGAAASVVLNVRQARSAIGWCHTNWPTPLSEPRLAAFSRCAMLVACHTVWQISEPTFWHSDPEAGDEIVWGRRIRIEFQASDTILDHRDAR
jgi:hypothetical protein